MPVCGGNPARVAYANETGTAYAASVTPAKASSVNQLRRYSESHFAAGNAR
jgi:hypothetical protein